MFKQGKEKAGEVWRGEKTTRADDECMKIKHTEMQSTLYESGKGVL